MPSYDRAITVFSPDGHLFQVEYAMEAVRRGTAAVSICGEDVIVLGVEKKSAAKLQDTRSIQKICQVDKHIVLAFAGFTADARVLVNMARLECQRYRLSLCDEPSVRYIAKYVARVQQRFTQRGGRRPFGLSCVIVGFEAGGGSQLYVTDPAGTEAAWKAAAIGKSDKELKEFLEKHYEDLDKEDNKEEATIRLCARALMEVVENGAKNIDIAIIKKGKEMELLARDQLENMCDKIEKEKEESAAKERKSKNIE